MRLQAHEIRKGWMLRPFEIQSALKLPNLHEQYGIPDDESIEIRHRNRVRTDISQYNIHPKFDFKATDLEGIHKFDSDVKGLVKSGSLSFYYQSSKKSRISDEL